MHSINLPRTQLPLIDFSRIFILFYLIYAHAPYSRTKQYNVINSISE